MVSNETSAEFLDQGDELVAERRDHAHERLRQHHVAHDLARRHAERCAARVWSRSIDWIAPRTISDT